MSAHQGRGASGASSATSADVAGADVRADRDPLVERRSAARQIHRSLNAWAQSDDAAAHDEQQTADAPRAAQKSNTALVMERLHRLVKRKPISEGADVAEDTSADIHLAPKSTVKADPGRNGSPKGATSSGAEAAKVQDQRKQQRKDEQKPSTDDPKKLPFQPLSDDKFDELEKKVKDRTATPEEAKHLDWDRRFNNRRKRGVDRFWSQEKQRLKAGQPPSRNWTPEQRAAILNDEVPKGPDGKPMEGHHMHNAADFPQKAADGKNIAPVTKPEHLKKWHGGNFQNDTKGKPNKPDHPDCF